MDILQKNTRTSGKARTAAPLLRRPAREDLLALARRRFVRGQYGDLEGLARELGISRATAYLWVGNADQLSDLVISGLLVDAYRQAEASISRASRHRTADVVVLVMRSIAAFKPYREFFERNPEKALRIVASKAGSVQQAAIAHVQGLLEAERACDNAGLAVDCHTMAYAIVRLVESFLYADFIANEQLDLEKAEAIIRFMLGAHASAQSSPSPARPRRRTTKRGTGIKSAGLARPIRRS